MATVRQLIPEDPAHLPAIWCFCKSPEFHVCGPQNRPEDERYERHTDQGPLRPRTLAECRRQEYPNGLPEPHSDDPTQWLFKGHPKGSTDPLQVAVARLLGYRWPDQEPDEPRCLADKDGIVPIPGRAGRAARRGAAAWRSCGRALGRVSRMVRRGRPAGKPDHKLLTDAGCEVGHVARRLAPRPVLRAALQAVPQPPVPLAHLGRSQGRLLGLVNYHKLDHKPLENLTYSYLGDWITAQSRSRDKVGADLRLAAAQALQDKLKLILAGEPPYDIFVRWKPLHEQPIGWNPDLNDGVRINIRPFMTAGVLRKNPNIKWGKDRGKEPERDRDEYPWFWKDETFTGDRVNDVHLSNAQKSAARNKAGLG